MFLGASRVVATEFSFFLAIPTMVAASTWSLFKYGVFLNIYQFYLLPQKLFLNVIELQLALLFKIEFLKDHH
jgi:undecaprenyl-diphosphatase